MIYLDNAAATPVSAELLQYYSDQVAVYYPNQEAGHGAAYQVREELRKAARTLSMSLVGDDSADVFWCNSGTEGLSSVLRLKDYWQGNVVSTAIEHPALYHALKETDGLELRHARIQPDGLIDIDHLGSLIDENTSLIAVHMVHSETGAVQDLAAIRRQLVEKRSSSRFLVDTIQAAGKLPIPWKDAGIDICVMSGHKIGSVGGGAVVFRHQDDYVAVQKLRSDSHQLSRPEPAVALTLAFAIASLAGDMESNQTRMKALSTQLRETIAGIQGAKGGLRSTIPPEHASPYIVNLQVPGYQGGVLVRMLSEEGVMVSAGSACEAETRNPSRALTAMGLSRNDAFSALRVSLWLDTKEDDITTFADVLKQCLEQY